MTDVEKSKRDAELDDFWNPDKLMPKPKKQYQQRQVRSVDTVEIDIPPRSESTESKSDFVLTRKHDPQRPEIRRNGTVQPTQIAPERVFDYPEGLIHQVKVINWSHSFSFFEQFITDGKRFFGLKGAPCQYKEFFSYIPQYAQLDSEQLAWYLFWRDNARDGKYLDTGFSYIMLYVYELINICGDMPPEAVLKQLCGLLNAYNKDHPRLIQYLSEWICDFSLIHGLSAPYGMLESIYDDMLSYTTLKEFYVNPAFTENNGEYSGAFMEYCSNYKYKKSKYYADNKELYDKYISGAVSLAVEFMRGESYGSRYMTDTTVLRDTYVGALCSHKIKKRLEVSYCSFSRSHEMRFLITDTVKYTENKLRAYLGLKSKISVTGLPDALKKKIDEYLGADLPVRVKVKPPEPKPDYEKLYDLPTQPLSLSRASQIERESWGTTERLVEAFADAPEEEFIPEITEIPEKIPEKATETGGAFGELTEFLTLALNSDIKGEREWAKSRGRMLDAIADEINGISVESDIGDMILVEENGAYTVISDYIEDVNNLIGDKNGG